MTRPPAARTRVLIVAPTTGILGGQAIQAVRLLEGLSTSDTIEATFLPVNPPLSGLWGACQRIKYLRTIVTSLAYVASLIRRVPSVDVVHAFSASYFSYLLSPLPALVIGRLFGKSTILNYRSGEADDHLARWRLTAKPTMRRFANVIVTPSEYLVQVFAHHGLNARAISNFVPIERLPYRRRVVIGPRFLSNRNHETLYNVGCVVRAFAIVWERYPESTLTVVGDGSKRHELETLVKDLGLSDAVTFLGRVEPENMGRHYDAADIYLNSPNIDNMPISIIEAFACGIPVVSTDAGGIPFIVENGRTGLLTAKNDHRALADSAMRILQDPTFGLALADNARRECETKYVWPAVQARWELLYRSLDRQIG